jgi:hypothetical protein
VVTYDGEIIPVTLLRIIDAQLPCELANFALICLVNVSIHSESHQVLLKHRALEIALSKLHLVHETDFEVRQIWLVLGSLSFSF